MSSLLFQSVDSHPLTGPIPDPLASPLSAPPPEYPAPQPPSDSKEEEIAEEEPTQATEAASQAEETAVVAVPPERTDDPSTEEQNTEEEERDMFGEQRDKKEASTATESAPGATASSSSDKTATKKIRSVRKRRDFRNEMTSDSHDLDGLLVFTDESISAGDHKARAQSEASKLTKVDESFIHEAETEGDMIEKEVESAEKAKAERSAQLKSLLDVSSLFDDDDEQGGKQSAKSEMDLDEDFNIEDYISEQTK